MQKTANKQTKTATKAVAEQKEVKINLADKVVEALHEAMQADKNIKVQKVTGYISVKYGNKVLFEFHNKKKSIPHLTFSTKQKAYDILKSNKLIHRVVPASYGWKYNTECLLTDEFIKHFPSILKSVLAEAIEERNLKAKPADKKVAKKA